MEPVPKPAAGGQLRGAVSPENTSNYFALIPGRCRRSRPYLCSPEKIQRIINAAAELPSIYGFRRLTGLLGIEGSASALYFEQFESKLKQRDDWKFDWRGRNRRPPRDPVNALLSLGFNGIKIKDTIQAQTARFQRE